MSLCRGSGERWLLWDEGEEVCHPLGPVQKVYHPGAHRQVLRLKWGADWEGEALGGKGIVAREWKR